MKIVVCIKQVPDTADIKWTENNTIQREGVESIINPFDMYAIETALKLKDVYENTTVTTLTMGPNQAENIIRKSISMGVDSGFVLSDKKFAGSDTLATAKTISTGIQFKIPDFDLVICGQFATDGDTAQTGSGVATNLDVPVITYVKEVKEIKDGYVTVLREVEDGKEVLKAKLPAVLCMLKCDYEPRRAYINGYRHAQKAEVKFYSHEDISISPEETGFKGSPTYVSKAFRPEEKQSGELIKTDDLECISNKILEVLNG